MYGKVTWLDVGMWIDVAMKFLDVARPPRTKALFVTADDVPVHHEYGRRLTFELTGAARRPVE
jgi:hypothetical protein